MTKVNSNIASILGFDGDSDELENEQDSLPQQRENVTINVPAMEVANDPEQLEQFSLEHMSEVAAYAMAQYNMMFSSVMSVEPSARARYLEVMNGTLKIALEAAESTFKAQKDMRSYNEEKAKETEAEVLDRNKVIEMLKSGKFD